MDGRAFAAIADNTAGTPALRCTAPTLPRSIVANSPAKKAIPSTGTSTAQLQRSVRVPSLFGVEPVSVPQATVCSFASTVSSSSKRARSPRTTGTQPQDSPAHANTPCDDGSAESHALAGPAEYSSVLSRASS